MGTGRQALLVATDEYVDPSFRELRAPGGDVQALAEVLSNPKIGSFDVRPVLTNEPKDVVCEQIEDFFSNARSDDLLLLYLSCHGILSPSRQLYFAATNTKFSKLRASGISDSFINDVMHDSRSGRILLVLDCCHSGAFGSRFVTKSGGPTDLASRFEGRGQFTLTASSALEYAFEERHGERLEPGAARSVFTRVLIDGLRSGEADRNRDGHVSLDELYEYVYEGVQKVTPHQTPELIGKLRGGLYIAKSPHETIDLPEEIQNWLESNSANIRLAAVKEVHQLRSSRDPALARAADAALRALVDDDSRSVSAAAASALGPSHGYGSETVDGVDDESMLEASPAGESDQTEALDRGRNALKSGRPDVALTHFERMLARDSTDCNALTGRGWAQFRLHRFDDAASNFDHALAVDAHHADALVGRARVKIEQSELTDALRDLERVPCEQRSAAAHIARGLALGSLLRVDALHESVAEFDAALALDQTCAEASALRGNALWSLGDHEAGLADYERALEVDSRQVAALLGRVEHLTTDEANEEARRELKRAIDLDPNSPAVWVAHATVLMVEDRAEEARAQLDRVLAVNPNDVSALVFRASMGGSVDENEGALHDAERVARLLPTSGVALVLVAFLRLELDQYEAALRDLDRALEIDEELDTALRLFGMPPNGIQLLRGRAYHALGRSEESVGEFGRALVSDPSDLEALVGRAAALIAIERWDAALGDLNRAVAVNPESDELRSWRRTTASRVDPKGVPSDLRVEIEEQRQQNCELLASAPFEKGYYDRQKETLLERVTGTEQLLWICRCARATDVFRSVALVLTSEKLLWCHESVVASATGAWYRWDAIIEIAESSGGFSVKTSDGTTIAFNQITRGADLSGEGLELSSTGVCALARHLAGLPAE